MPLKEIAAYAPLLRWRRPQNESKHDVVYYVLFFFFVFRVVFRNLGKFQEARRAALSTLIRELIKRNQEVRRK